MRKDTHPTHIKNYYKSVRQFNRKMGKIFEYFTKEIQMVNTHVERYSGSLLIREMLLKPQRDTTKYSPDRKNVQV